MSLISERPFSVSDPLWRRALIVLGTVACLAVMIAVHLLTRPTGKVRGEYTNRLVFESSGSSVTEEVAVIRLHEAHYLDRGQIRELRRTQLSETPGLLSGKYKISPILLNYADLKRGWESEAERHLRKVSLALRETLKSSPAAELDLANPHLLLRPEFSQIAGRTDLPWDPSKIKGLAPRLGTAWDIQARPSMIIVERDQSKLEVKYDLTKFVRALVKVTKEKLDPNKGFSFNVVAYNAVDLGLPFVKFNPELSQGVVAGGGGYLGPSRAYWYIKYSEDRCPATAGCNFGTGFFTPRLAPVSITKLPAKAVYELYPERPRPGSDLNKQRVLFVIQFK